MFSATVWVVLALGLYLLPAMVAAGRKHRSGTAITALNILLGWTFVGWVAALVWALTGNVIEVSTAAGYIKCPECRETILKGARKCKHCGSALAGPAAPPAGMRACPDCSRLAPVAEKNCPACGHAMAPA